MGSDGVEELVDGGALVVGLVVEIHGEHDEEKRESRGMEDGGERERDGAEVRGRADDWECLTIDGW